MRRLGPRASRGRLVPVVLGFLGVALFTMLAFDSTPMRVIGVLSLFGFIVSGVFAIATPAFLDGDVDDEPVRPQAALDEARSGYDAA